MFWKNVNFKKLIFATMKSITLRLTLLYIASMLLILSIISGVLYISLKENLRKNEHQFLTSESILLTNVNMAHQTSLIKYLHHEKDETLEDYWETLLTTSFFGILAITILGMILADRSMRPLKNIMRAMRKTSVNQLSVRLTIEDKWPEEFTNLAQHFNIMLERLDHSFNRLSQFSADLAHEIRTPINNLKGEAEVCLMKSRTPVEYQQVITSSLEEYTRISRLIESLLFLARTEIDDRQLIYSQIPLKKMLQSILEFYQPIADEQHITLAWVDDTNYCIVLTGDELLLQRALHNLCSNALRYTLSGGKLTISIKVCGDRVMVNIKDTGIGIAAEHLPHVFERFYRTDDARAQVSGGNGLGLAIVKSIMDLHHADIKIESQIKHGTTVSLIFNTWTTA